jgi:adenine deaminase
MLREGSASKNLEALAPVVEEFELCFLVSDDKHPEELREGHINSTLKKIVKLGIDPLKAIAMVTLNPSEHYKLGRGVLEKGMPADIVIFNNLKDFNITHVYIAGELVAQNGKILYESHPEKSAGTINVPLRKHEDFAVEIEPLLWPGGPPRSDTTQGSFPLKVRVIELVPDNIITKEHIETMKAMCLVAKWPLLVGDLNQDIIKLVVVNRYAPAPIAKGFIKGFGLKEGALASSVAHDSHNIIAAGLSDIAITKAVNTVISNQGGFAVVDNNGENVMSLKLPVAGLMSTEKAEHVADELKELQAKVTEYGSKLTSPFLTLSFMALLVIPELKLSDKGLFDGRTFKFVDLIINEK